MEETLGKRIVANRRRLGLTQDALAEQLGVTAQAVSKWENDQSCPDITMLPKLAQIFDITTDALLGLERKDTPTAEVVPAQAEADEEPEGFHIQKGPWDFQWDTGRRGGIGIGLWVLLVGGLLLFSRLTERNMELLNLLFPCGLLVFGLFGLYPKFSVFRLGCGLFGCYCLLDLFDASPFGLDLGIILPVFLLLAGVHLVVNSLRKPRKEPFQMPRSGSPIGGTSRNHCTYSGEFFDCATGFGENRYLIQLPRLSGGRAEVGFGEMTVDLSGCEEIGENCRLELKCGFGELILLVPKKWRVVPYSDSAFGSVDTEGNPDPTAEAALSLDCSVSFGDIRVRYI